MKQPEYTIVEIDKNDEKPGIQLLSDGRLILCFGDDGKRCNSDCPGFEFVKWHDGGENRVILHCLGKREIKLTETSIKAKSPVKKNCFSCEFAPGPITGGFRCSNFESPYCGQDTKGIEGCNVWAPVEK